MRATKIERAIAELETKQRELQGAIDALRALQAGAKTLRRPKAIRADVA